MRPLLTTNSDPLGVGVNDVEGLDDVLAGLVDPTELSAGLATKSDLVHSHVVSDITGLATDLSNKQDISAKNVNDGYAGLDSSGKIQTSALPALAITTPSVVASQAAQLSLTAQEGDVAIRSDENKTYIHNGGTASSMADWTQLATPTDLVLSVAGKTGVVSLVIGDITNLQTALDDKALSTHTHVIADVTSLQSSLDAKINNSLIDAKGDLVVGASNDTPTIVGVGSDNQVLIADVAQTNGIKWGAVPGISAKLDSSVITTNGKGFINHGSDANVARPSGFVSIEWVGTVQPNNWIAGDTWVDES